MALPSGTVTLLFTDVEGSTRLVQQLGDGYGAVLEELRRLLRGAVAQAGGSEVDCRADELFAAFERARDGVAAAVAAQRLVAARVWPEGVRVRVRMGLHTGEPAVAGGVYLGLDVNRAARICAAGHGGQILLSQTTRDLVADGAVLRDLGSYALAGLPRPERIFRLDAPGLGSDFPPLRVEGTEADRRRRRLLGSRSRQPTLEQAAWRVRALLPTAAPHIQKPLAELGAELFTAYRALTGAEGFLSRIDRKRLAQQLSAQQELAFVSKQARQEAEALQRQIGCVERLFERRQALAELAAELLPARFDAADADAGIAKLRGRIAAATAELDQAVTQAAGTLDPRSYKLERTRSRGVYRSGRLYVVPFIDELGRERRREFETATQARDFRTGLRIAEKAQTDYTGPSYKGHGVGGENAGG